MKEDAPQRDHPLREVFNDLPPWYTVYQQAQRWIAAGVFEDMVHDLRALASFDEECCEPAELLSSQPA
jgi:hypothetical protein